MTEEAMRAYRVGQWVSRQWRAGKLRAAANDVGGNVRRLKKPGRRWILSVEWHAAGVLVVQVEVW